MTLAAFVKKSPLDGGRSSSSGGDLKLISQPIRLNSGYVIPAGTSFEPVTANDLSGPGGGASGCCWTTGLFKVSVKPAGTAPPTGVRQ